MKTENDSLQIFQTRIDEEDTSNHNSQQDLSEQQMIALNLCSMQSLDSIKNNPSLTKSSKNYNKTQHSHKFIGNQEKQRAFNESKKKSQDQIQIQIKDQNEEDFVDSDKNLDLPNYPYRIWNTLNQKRFQGSFIENILNKKYTKSILSQKSDKSKSISNNQEELKVLYEKCNTQSGDKQRGKSSYFKSLKNMRSQGRLNSKKALLEKKKNISLQFTKKEIGLTDQNVIKNKSNVSGGGVHKNNQYSISGIKKNLNAHENQQSQRDQQTVEGIAQKVTESPSPLLKKSFLQQAEPILQAKNHNKYFLFNEKSDQFKKQIQGTQNSSSSDAKNQIRNNAEIQIKTNQNSQMNFESPKNTNLRKSNKLNDQSNPNDSVPGSGQSVVQEAVSNIDKNCPKTHSSHIDSIQSNAINPLESPDIISAQAKNKLKNQNNFPASSFFQGNMGTSNIQLREMRIESDLKNENKKQLDQESEYNIYTAVRKFNEENVQPLTTKSGPIGAWRTRALQNGQFISASMDRYNNLYSVQGKDLEQEEITNLKKMLREEKSKFITQKAVLEQQVQLLHIQLHEASEREKSLKKTYSTMLKALQNKNDYLQPKSSSQKQDYQNGDSYNYNRQKSQIFQSINDQNSDRKSQEDNQELQRKIDELQNSNQELKKQTLSLATIHDTQKQDLKTQEQLIIQKDEELTLLRKDKQQNEGNYKKLEFMNQQEKIIQEQSQAIENLNRKIELIQRDSDRKILLKTDEYQDRERNINDRIIDLQREVQNLNQELDTQRKMVHLKDLRSLELEKQIIIHETQLLNQNRDTDIIKADNEWSTKKYVDEIAMLNNVIQKITGQDNFSHHMFSDEFQTNQESLQVINENIESTNEQNKFILSPNCSVLQSNQNYYEQNMTKNQENIQDQINLQGQLKKQLADQMEANIGYNSRCNNTNMQSNEYSFGEEQRLNQLGFNRKKSSSPSPNKDFQLKMLSSKKSIQIQNVSQDPHSLQIPNQSTKHEINLRIDISGLLSNENMLSGESLYKIDSLDSQANTERLKDHKTLISQDKSRKIIQKADKNNGKAQEITENNKNSQPYKVQYWCNEEKFVDDGSWTPENLNALRRLVADLRSQLSRLTVTYNDLKSNSHKEIQRLRNLVLLERKKRVTVQEEKLEKSSTFIQELVERDKKICNLQNEMLEIQMERNESINQTYFGLGDGLNGLGTLNKSLYRSGSIGNSQYLYGALNKQLKKEKQLINKQRASILSSHSQKSLNSQKKQFNVSNNQILNRKKSYGGAINNQGSFLLQPERNIQNHYGSGQVVQDDEIVYSQNKSYQQIQSNYSPRLNKNKINQLQKDQSETNMNQANHQEQKKGNPLVINSPNHGHLNRVLTMKSLEKINQDPKANFKQFINNQLQIHQDQINLQSNANNTEFKQNRNRQVNDLFLESQKGIQDYTSLKKFEGRNANNEKKNMQFQSQDFDLQQAEETKSYENLEYRYNEELSNYEVLENTDQEDVSATNDQPSEDNDVSKQQEYLYQLQSKVTPPDNLNQCFSPISIKCNTFNLTTTNNNEKEQIKKILKNQKIEQQHSSEIRSQIKNIQLNSSRVGQQYKKNETNYDSEDEEAEDCNVEAEVGEESIVNHQKQKNNHFNLESQSIKNGQYNAQQKNYHKTQRENVNQAKKVPPLNFIQILNDQGFEDNFIQSARDQIQTKPQEKSLQEQRSQKGSKKDQLNESSQNVSSVKNPSSLHQANKISYSTNNSQFQEQISSKRNDKTPTIYERRQGNILSARPMYTLRGQQTQNNQELQGKQSAETNNNKLNLAKNKQNNDSNPPQCLSPQQQAQISSHETLLNFQQRFGRNQQNSLGNTLQNKTSYLQMGLKSTNSLLQVPEQDKTLQVNGKNKNIQKVYGSSFRQGSQSDNNPVGGGGNVVTGQIKQLQSNIYSITSSNIQKTSYLKNNFDQKNNSVYSNLQQKSKSKGWQA